MGCSDYLEGGAGSDTVVFGRGSGNDVLHGTDTSAGKADVLMLEGLNASDIVLSKGIADTDLTITIKDTGESIKLNYFFDGAVHQISQLKFADGTAWDTATILAKEVSITGDDAANTLNGRNGGPNTLIGLGGNDRLNGGDGSDRLLGGDGNDGLYGGSGNDTLSGGAGNDTLDGGAGSDTVVFGRGMGQDVLHGTDTSAGKADVLMLEGLNANDIVLSKGNADSDLTITIKDTGESIKLNYFFDGAVHQISQLKFADGTAWDTATILAKEMGINGDDAANTLNGRNGGPNTLIGLGGNDRLNGGDGNDRLFGGDGNDALYGGGGNDTLSGGAGNDTLDGGAGSDTVVFGRGMGHDVLHGTDVSAGKADVLMLEGLNANDIVFSKGNADTDLTITIKDTGESIKLNYFFDGAVHQISQLRFADGTAWDTATILAKEVSITGDDAANTLNGRNGGPNTLIGLGGNDRLNGGDGNDRLFGGDGNDALYGGTGNDTLSGGAGNDYLEGGAGSDTVVFGRGMGHDVLHGTDTSAGKADVLMLDGLNANDVVLSKGNADSDLTITIKDTGESIKLNYFFDGAAHQISQLKFADGTAWNTATILAQEVTITGDNAINTLNARDGGPNALYGLGGNGADVVQSSLTLTLGTKAVMAVGDDAFRAANEAVLRIVSVG